MRPARRRHLLICDECRETAFVWYLRFYNVSPLPANRRDPLWVRLRHWLGYDGSRWSRGVR